MTAKLAQNTPLPGRKHRMCTEPLGDYFALAGST